MIVSCAQLPPLRVSGEAVEVNVATITEKVREFFPRDKAPAARSSNKNDSNDADEGDEDGADVEHKATGRITNNNSFSSSLPNFHP